jgi:uncharacterized membrane protein
MRIFSLHPIVLIALIALLVVGSLLLLVAAPVAFINWFWNAIIAAHSGLPLIGIFQAGLLYFALICLLYISDLVHVEFKAEKIN